MSLNNFKNILYNTYLFHTRIQKPREPFDDFFSDLIQLSLCCDFNNPEKRIRDQIIIGVNDNNLRGALFTLRDPTLRDLLEFLNKNLGISNIKNLSEVLHYKELIEDVNKRNANNLNLNKSVNSEVIVEKDPIIETHVASSNEAGPVNYADVIKLEENSNNAPRGNIDLSRGNENTRTTLQGNTNESHQGHEIIITIKAEEDEEEINIEDCSSDDNTEIEVDDNISQRTKIMNLDKSSNNVQDLDSNLESLRTNQEQSVKCKKCKRFFKSSRSLQNHMRIHRKNFYLQPSKKRIISNKKNLHKCNQCGQSFKLRTQLQKHSKIHRVKKDLYKCQVCSKTFLSKVYLKAHMRLHEETGTHNCTKCDKKFIYPCRLRDHLATH